MSRRGRKTAIGGQFAPRTIEMLESPAYRVLSLSARKVLDRLEIEMAHHGGTDNGKLPVTYDQFQEYGIDRQAIAPAIREAVALGLLEITREGRAGNAEWRQPNLFRLTYRHSDGERGYGTNEWRQIESLEEAAAIAKAARSAKPKKTKSQWGKTSRFSRENPNRKRPIHSGETPTTCHSGKTPTTIDISGRMAAGPLASQSPATGAEDAA
ncbi:hypothetical protein [Bradyrhizobium lablabi]|uniref:hypothetical protein n=1 Tax=Bradyrhizobium lablabi TaxID=722472 RepID=UPI001BAD90D7|nr:hypothetical protein [Bradyrhizobium lablabi]MBR0697743.1 hypothetical protein [Bradyrhizobium lablabi]